MAATIPSTSLIPVQPVFTDAERLALAGFLAGYRGLTREACTCSRVRRAHTETFARELEDRGRARATVTRRLCAIAAGSAGTPSRKSS